MCLSRQNLHSSHCADQKLTHVDSAGQESEVTKAKLKTSRVATKPRFAPTDVILRSFSFFFLSSFFLFSLFHFFVFSFHFHFLFSSLFFFSFFSSSFCFPFFHLLFVFLFFHFFSRLLGRQYQKKSSNNSCCRNDDFL